MQILTIALVTIKEASRRKLLLALLILTLIVIGLSVYGLSRLSGITIREGGARHPITAAEVRAVTSQLLIVVMFMFTFVLALSAALTAAPSIASEVESGVILTVLTRPISRTEVVLGKWLGLAFLSLAYVGVA